MREARNPDARRSLTCDGGIVEVQATAEDKPLFWDQMVALNEFATKAHA